MYDAHLQRPCLTKRYELDISRRPEIEAEIAKQIAAALNRPLAPALDQERPRYSRDPLAYAEFIRGYRLTAGSDSSLMDKASQHLTNAVTRDPGFALAHAMLSFACATRHFEFDPVNAWLEKAEFHCRRSLELAPDLPEGHVARAFLFWGPSKNFQHIEAIADLKRALALQSNLSHAYNRLGSILAHIGLLDHAREMFHRGSWFHPKKAVSPSIVQVYVWNQEYDAAREEIDSWLRESPSNKYARYFAPQPAMMTGDFEDANRKIDEALKILPEEPLIVSLQGALFALMGKGEAALECITKACASPKSFGHAHHTYYQIACILSITERLGPAFEWLDRSVSTGFACWPFFLKDPCLQNLNGMPEFEMLISTLQAKYPDHLGLL
jgi:tetratricopeptide (TPR) repeat protein